MKMLSVEMTDSEAGIELNWASSAPSAEMLEKLIFAAGGLRAATAPAVAPKLPKDDTYMLAENPLVMLQSAPSKGSILRIRHPAYRWIAVSFTSEYRQQLIAALAQHQAAGL